MTDGSTVFCGLKISLVIGYNTVNILLIMQTVRDSHMMVDDSCLPSLGVHGCNRLGTAALAERRI